MRWNMLHSYEDDYWCSFKLIRNDIRLNGIVEITMLSIVS